MKRIPLFFVLLLAWVAMTAQTTQQADCLHQRGRELLNEGKIAEGRECTRRAMEMRKALLGEVSEDYITSLNNYAMTYGMEKDYRKAVELQEQVMTLCGKLKTPHKNIGMYTVNMGRFYYLNGDKTKAAVMWERAIPLVEKHGEIYEFLLNSLGSVYSDTGDQQGLSRIMALMEEHNQHELTKPCDEPKCMLERAQYYGSTGDNAKAKECYQKVLAMKMDDAMKVNVFETYARFMAFTANDRQTAAEYQHQAALLRKGMKGEDADYAQSMYYAGMYYTFAMTDVGYTKAIPCIDGALSTYEKLNDGAMKAKCQQLKGHALGGLKDYAKAKECYVKALAYYEANDKENDEYPKMIERVAAMEKFNKEYDASIAHYRQAMALFEARGMMQEYGNAENGLKLCYAYAGKRMEDASDGTHRNSIAEARQKKLDGIIADELQNLELTRTYLGKLAYARSLGTIAGCYAMKVDYAHAVDYYQQYMENIREGIREEFRYESEAERMHTWSEETTNIAELQELLVDLPDSMSQYRGSLAALMYDTKLLSKGILLNSSIEFEKLLNSKGDPQLTDIYQRTKANRNEIERLRREAASDADMERIITLTQENQRLQVLLNEKFREMDDFTRYISYNWKDVQSKLEPGDISIEFASVNVYLDDELTHMMAILLTKEMAQPEAVMIWDEEEQQKYRDLLQQDSVLFTKPDGGQIVWGRLAAYLQGKKRIFFSADGVLNNIGIEYLPMNGKPLSEQYEVYRLSSTKELCYQRENRKPTKAALFGDINYNEGATRSEAAQQSLMALRGFRGSSDADGFADLSNTLREVNEIQSILKSNGIQDAERFHDSDASKSAFMELTGKQVNLLHIATHGAYRSVKKSTDAESMQNSLLAFAGANLDDSGIVTAADIATMNLRECDLAVLSACETGLGKLGGDGVFGLQRGFKNAGVHTLLMSLKNVPDGPTADLMISFYRHLMAGSSKREALVKAQQDIRNKGFNDPQYWATFILLDAI